MVQQVFSRIRIGAGLCAVVATVVLSGCSQESQLADVGEAEAGLASSWVLCAKQGEHCVFSDTRRVRYGTRYRFVTKTFTNGVHCDSKQFGARLRTNATCSYESIANTPSTPPATGTSGAAAPAPTAGTHADHMAAGAGGMGGAAGMAMEPTAGSGMDHSGHMPASGMPGPYIDLSAIPRGDTGSSTVDIAPTSEQPVSGDEPFGAFRTFCTYSHMLNDDPIVFPGQPGKAHLHAFFGNTNVDAHSTQTSIRETGNSTCRGGIANRSSYWVPALIDAEGKPVEPEGMHVYYKSGYGGIAPHQIQKFPSGLRVVAGSAKASAPQENAYWGCHNNYIGHPSTIPQCAAGDSIAMHVLFPQCWDGVNLDSPDHVSHMSYTVNGKCPSTHPVAIPAITFNVLYPARDVTGWRLSSDMYSTDLPGGFSAHADWFEGWDPEISETFVENCVQRGVDCHSHLLGDGRAIH